MTTAAMMRRALVCAIGASLLGGLQGCGSKSSPATTPPPKPVIALGFSPTSGPIGTLITIFGTEVSSVSAVSVAGVSEILLDPSSSSVVAYVMPGTGTGPITLKTASRTYVTSTNFTVTATGVPAVPQGAKLVGTGSTGPADQSRGLALSADGNTAIVGGPNDNSAVGAIWVFTRAAGVWAQQGTKLVGTGGTGAASQGSVVAVSADGNTAVVGGNADNSGAGAIWVFTRTAGVWAQQGSKLAGTGATAKANQGYAVALSADGNTAVETGTNDSSNVGAIWVFTRTAGIWAQQGSKLVGTGATQAANQGISVALSADGNTLIEGGYIDNGVAGAAWVFTRTAGVWAQQGSKLVGTGASGTASQGLAVALSADGNTAIVGGPTDSSSVGAAWVFTRTAGVWAQQGSKLVGTGASGASEQGFSVSLSADGNTAILGGNNDNSGDGAIWGFTRTAGVWAQQGTKLVGTGVTGADSQGSSVALSADGNTLIEGGPSDNANAGATWVFIP